MKQSVRRQLVGLAALALIFETTWAFASDDQDRLAQGKALYGTHCAECHGKNLEGEPNWRRQKPDGTMPAPPHDVSGHTWHHSDQVLFDYTKKGGEEMLKEMGITGFDSGMPGFGEVMSDQEILDVLVYIKSWWPDKIRKHQESVSRQN